MAQVSAYSTAHGKRYRVRFRTPDGRQTEKRGFRTKREAEAAMNRIEVDKLTGTYLAPSLGLVTVGELAKSWLVRKESTIAPSYYHTLASAWKVHVEPRWSSVKLADIDTLGVEAWVARMTKAGHAATTVIRAHGVLSGILADAVKSKPQRLAANPAAGIEGLPRKTAKRHVYLNAADVERLADAAGEHRVLVLVLAYCGLRWGCQLRLVPDERIHALGEQHPHVRPTGQPHQPVHERPHAALRTGCPQRMASTESRSRLQCAGDVGRGVSTAV